MARPKGSPNKNKVALLNHLQNKFGDEWNPVIEMAQHAVELSKAANTSRKREDRESAIAALDKVAVYVTPKLKQMEVDLSNTDGSLAPPKGIRLVPVSEAYLKRQSAQTGSEELSEASVEGPTD